MKIVKPVIVLAIFFILLLQIFLLILIAYFKNQAIYDELSNQLYSGNNIVLIDKQDVNWVNSYVDQEYRLFVEFNENYRALIKNTSSWEPPMISGYFPDAGKSGLKAVVGKNALNSTIEIEGKKYIEFRGQMFEIVGVVGADYPTSCDNLVILFGIDFSPDDLCGAKIVLDAKNEKVLSIVKNSITSGNPSITTFDGTQKGSARLIKSSYFSKLLLGEAILLVAFSLLSFTRYWHEKNKTVRYVYFFMGVFPIRIIAYEIAEIIAVNIFSTIMVILLAPLLKVIELENIKNILIIGVSIMLFSCLSIVVFNYLDTFNRTASKES